MLRAKQLACALVFAIGFSSLSAQAALTDSEKSQIKSFVREGRAEKAARVRALVARPDLSPEEAAEPLIAGFERARFDQRRETFAKALLFGPGSKASRNDLVAPLVRALLARAGQALSELPPSAEAMKTPRARSRTKELLRLYAFITREVANAGSPPPGGHDQSQAIRDDALRAAVELMKQHLEDHKQWLRPGGSTAGQMVAPRAQAQLAVVDLGRGILGRHELSSALGLSKAQRGVFERHGVLVEDAGRASTERVELAIALLEASELGPKGVSLWLLGKHRLPELASSGVVARAGTPLTKQAVAGEAGAFLGEEVSQVAPDRELAEVAFSAGLLAARNTLAASPALKERAQAAAERAARGGPQAFLARDLPASLIGERGETQGVAEVSPTLLLAHTLRVVLVDAERALELALARAAAGRPEALDQLALALSVLAFSEGGDAREELTLWNNAADAKHVPVTLKDISVEKSVVQAFQVGERKLSFVSGDDGAVREARLDGKPVEVASLRFVRLQTEAKERWRLGSEVITRLHGAPRGLAVDGGRFILEPAAQSRGFDSVVTGPRAAPRTRLKAKLAVSGVGGGVLVGARNARDSYQGVAILLEQRSVQIVRVDGRGKAVELVPATKLGEMPEEGYPVEVELRGSRLSVRVGAFRKTQDLQPIPLGQMGFTARPGGKVVVRDLKVSR